MSSADEPRNRPDGDRPHHISSNGEVPGVETSLPIGVHVQVRTRFDGAWASGFRVFAGQTSGGYLVCRVSDSSVLPVIFAAAELRLDPVPLGPGARSSPPAVA